MKLTAKQRAKIYREAAEYFANDNWIHSRDSLFYPHGFCEFIRKIGPFPMEEFEEILLMKQRNGYWLNIIGDNNEPPVANHNQRVMCLLLAEQIALNP